MTALTRVALACGAALIMATAALGALHTDRKPARHLPASDRPAVSQPKPETTLPSVPEVGLGVLPDGIQATR